MPEETVINDGSPIVNEPIENSSGEQAPQQPDLAALHALAFNKPIQHTASENQVAAAVITENVATEAPVIDYTAYLKEHFGYEKVDEVKAEIERLKKTPVSEPTFSNEQSRKIYEAIRADKKPEVRKYLEAEEMLSGVDALPAEDKLKLHLKLQYPRYDAELIQDEYESLYSINESDFEGDLNGLRKAKLKLEQKIDNDVAAANEYFAKHKSKIELPEIASQQASDPGYERFKEYEASNAEYLEVIEKSIRPSVLAVKEADVQMNFTLKDDNNQMNFGYGVSVTKEDLDKARAHVLNWNDFVTKHSSDDKGDFSGTKAIALALIVENFEKYSQSIARQAVNAERQRVVSRVPSNGGQRDFSNTGAEPTELEELRKFAFPNRVR